MNCQHMGQMEVLAMCGLYSRIEGGFNPGQAIESPRFMSNGLVEETDTDSDWSPSLVSNAKRETERRERTI